MRSVFNLKISHITHNVISSILYIWIKKSAVKLVVIQCTCIAPSKGIQDILRILDSMQWSPDCYYWIPVFVSGTWILDSNRQLDSGFLQLYSGFHKQKFPGFRISYSLTWGKAVKFVCCSGRDMFNNISNYLWDRVFPWICIQALILFKRAVLVQHTPRITEVVVIFKLGVNGKNQEQYYNLVFKWIAIIIATLSTAPLELSLGSSNVFERRMSPGSEPFPLLMCLDATNFVLLSVFTLKEMICPRICWKSLLKSGKSPLPVDMHRSKLRLNLHLIQLLQN